MVWQAHDNWGLQARLMEEARKAFTRRKSRPTQYQPHPHLTILYFANGEWHSTKIMVVKKLMMPPPANRFTLEKPFKRGQIRSLGR